MKLKFTLTDNKTTHNELLKVLAIISMLIDHVGFLFFPEYEVFRWVGRIAFPIFAYQLAMGYIHTSNKKKYMMRLWIFGLIAQIPYTLCFDTYSPNILFTLLASLFLIDRIHKKEYYWIPSILILSIIFPIDYQWYGLFTPVLFYIFRNSKIKVFVSQTVLTLLYVWINGWIFQLFALLGVLICVYGLKLKWKIPLNKSFFYWFYPAHLTLLFIVKIFI